MKITLPQVGDRVTPELLRDITHEIEKAFERVYEYARVPAGGTTGQALQKASNRDYDFKWV